MGNSRLCAVVAVLLLFSLLSIAVQAEQVTCKLSTIDQKEYNGDVSFDGKVFRLTGKEKEESFTRLLVENIIYQNYREVWDEPTQIVIKLKNGDILEALFAEESVAENLSVSLPELGLVNIPFEEVSGVCFITESRNISEEKELLDGFQLKETEMDQVTLATGDLFSGILLSLNKEGVKVEADGKELVFTLDKVKAVKFAGASKENAFKEWYSIVKTTFGNQYSVIPSSIDADGLNGRTLLGSEFKLAKKNILSISFRNGAVKNLTDFTPISVDYKAYYYKTWKYRLNKSVNGSPLKLGGRVYSTGFGTHSLTTMVFKLEKKYNKFLATIGIDDETNGRGTVDFTVLADGKEIYKSKCMKSGEIEKVDVSVQDAEELTLISGYGGDDDLADHGNWCEPKLIMNIVDEG